MYWYSTESAGRPVVGRQVAVEGLVGDLVLEVQPVAQHRAAAGPVIFLIWWVALRPSISGPSVQPFTVLARITVGRPLPRFSVAAL